MEASGSVILIMVGRRKKEKARKLPRLMVLGWRIAMNSVALNHLEDAANPQDDFKQEAWSSFTVS